MSADLTPLETALGYSFENQQTLRHALVHSSAANRRTKSNERMEFLGDRVLGLVLAEMLLEAFPDEDEGEIGYRFTALAQRDALAKVAVDVGVAEYLQLSSGEQMTGGRENPGVQADGMEAVLAALYLDGGLDVARRVIIRHWTPMMRENRRPPKDPKTLLQEWAQGRGLGLPRYNVTGREGPDHQPVFTVEVRVADLKTAEGTGNNKRAAEQAAAEAILAILEDNEDSQ